MKTNTKTKKRKYHSRFRGQTKYNKDQWENVLANLVDRKYTSLGAYTTEEDAARAYDVASISVGGTNAVTNFPIGDYNDSHPTKKREVALL